MREARVIKYRRQYRLSLRQSLSGQFPRFARSAFSIRTTNSRWLGRTVYDCAGMSRLGGSFGAGFFLGFCLASSSVFASHRRILAPILTHALRLESLYRVCGPVVVSEVLIGSWSA